VTNKIGFWTLTLLTVSAGMALAATAGPGETPAFPGAEGFGAYAQGGRGGRVMLVTNLNDAGPGSLRAACEAEGPRIAVFRVSGVIELKSDLQIKHPHITIAGQTAPGGGICLKGYPLEIKADEVIVRYLRCRPGDVARKEMDSLSVSDARNVIVDHCSASWGMDETLSVTRHSNNVTVQWCMITESLNRSYHHKGAHGYGSLIVGYDGGYTFHHNLYAHHNSRNPRPGGQEGEPGILLDFRNNVIYDWGMTCGYSGDTRVRIDYVGNYLKPGPSARPSHRGLAFDIGGPQTSMFVALNHLEGYPEKNRDNWLMIMVPPEASLDAVRAPRPFPAARVKTDSARIAYRRVLAEAGATLPARDPVDTRIVAEVERGGGHIIDSQTEVGGWPEYASAAAPADADSDGMPDAWEIRGGLDPTDPADSAGDADGDGYTNIEEFLNGTDPRAASAFRSGDPLRSPDVGRIP